MYQQTFEPIPALFAQFAELLRSLTPSEEAAAVPGMDWNAGQVGAHVLTVLNRYLAQTERAISRSRLAALNSEDIVALDKSAVDVADLLDATIARFAKVAPSVPLEQTRAFHLGLEVTMAAAWSNLIGELLVHGTDIARAIGREWSIRDDLLEGIWRNLMPAAAGWMRPEAKGVDELYRFSFPFGTVTIHLVDGSVQVDNPIDIDRVADHTIIADDVAAVTLQFPYRRSLITDPSLALLASRFIDI